MTLPGTNPEPKPGAGAEAPPELAEIAALLAESQLARDEQERYLAVTRKMVEPPPMAWHRHALNVKKSPGMKSLAGVVIARLKSWGTTPPEQRAAIVEAVTTKDGAIIAERLRNAKFCYESQLRELSCDRRMTTAAEVRRAWEQLNAALAAARQPAVLLDNAVIHAEQAERSRAALPMLTVADMMAQHAAKREQAAALAPTPPVDPIELERRRLARAERERVEQRSRVEAEQAKEVEKRVKAFEGRALMLLTLNSPAGLDAALSDFRTVTLPKKRAEIEAEVLAEFAPRLAALAPPTRSTPPQAFMAAVHA